MRPPDDRTSYTPLEVDRRTLHESPQAERLLALSASFPTLRGVLDRWDPEALDRWACGPVPGSGAFHAAAFCLSVYNADAPWQCGPFDLQRALGTWDAAHRAAFLAWVRAPWWP